MTLFANEISMRLSRCLALGLITWATQASNAAPAHSPFQEEANHATLSQSQISELRAKAGEGDSAAQTELGHAYQHGNGVPQNAAVAVQWYRKAADQGYAAAENDLGIMYRTGQGVPLDKEEAVRWYAKSARHGNSQAMFNLGASYYNGDGVGENELTAYVWFLLAEDAGNPIAADAVKRSAATMSKKETVETFVKIAEMYDKGDELPKDEVQCLHWLEKAAENSSYAKVMLAGQLVKGPVAQRQYGKAMELCKAAAIDYAPGARCVGYLYRNGLGVDRNPGEALKWYQKAAPHDAKSAFDLAEMYSAGEGTKVDRPEAFMMFFHAGLLGAKDAPQKALALWRQMDRAEQKKTASKLRERNLDPDKVIAALQNIRGS
jgi:uncharacterized protein